MYDAVVISRTNINIRPYELPGLRSKSTQKISRSDSPMAVDSNLGRPGLLRPEVGPERVRFIVSPSPLWVKLGFSFN